MPTFQKRFPTGGIKSQERPFFKMKKFRKKFFDDAYFGRVISARDFLIFMGTIFLGENFFEKPTLEEWSQSGKLWPL